MTDFTKKEIELLKENGFKYVYDGEYSTYVQGPWAITKSKENVQNIIENYKCGFRVCICNKFSGNERFELSNIEDDGIWLCKSVMDCLRTIMMEEMDD